jgi:hypothetical protein
MLNLAEELFLLALDDDEGWIAAPAQNTLRYGLAAALLADLALRGKVVVDDRRVTLLDATPVGDELLDWALERLAAAGKPFKVKHWINALGFRKLPKQVAQRLVDCGVLREDDRRYAPLIPDAGSSQADAPAKYWIKHGLRSVVLTSAKAERRSLVLLSLMRGCRLLNLVFTRDERKAASKRAQELVRDEDFGDALEQTLADIEAATAAVSSEARAG